MATLQELQQAILKADELGNTEDVLLLHQLIQEKKDSEDITAGEFAAGLGTEIGVGTAGNIAGAYLAPFTAGLSYPVLSFTGGVAGNLAAQEIEGREDYSWGRAIAAGFLNLIPSGKAVKEIGSRAVAKYGAKEGSEAAVKEIPKELYKEALKQEAKRGAFIGAGESVAVSIIDEGRLPTPKEFAMYTGLGGAFGLGSGKFSPKFAEALGKHAGKKQQQLDQELSTGKPEIQDDVSTIVANGELGAKKDADRKITNQLDSTEQTEIVDNLTTPVPKRGFVQKHIDKYLGSIAPSWVTGRGYTDISFTSRKELRAYNQKAARLGRALNKELKKNPQLQGDVVRYLDTGEMSNDLRNNNKLHGELLSFNSIKRDLQSRLVDSLEAGTISSKSKEAQDKLVEKIKQSMEDGYVTTEYKMFLDPDFVPDPQQKIRAINEIADNLRLKDKALSEEDAIRKATDHLNDLESQSARVLSQQTGEIIRPQKVFGILQEKKLVGNEQAKYLGVLTDPSDRIEGTISKLGRLVVSNETDQRIVRELLSMGLATRKPTATMNHGLTLKTMDSGDTGVYVSPEIQAMVAKTYNNDMSLHTNNKLLKFAIDFSDALNAAIKVSNVVLSPIAYPTNFIGSVMTAAGAGAVSPTAIKGWIKGAKLSASEYGIIDDILTRGTPEQIQQFRDEVLRMQSLGLGDGNVLLNDLRANLSGNKLGEGLQKLTNPASKAYQLTDTAMRYAVWKDQQKSLSRMFSFLDERQIEELAAKVTNDIYQQYDKINGVWRTLSRFGLVQPYVSFVLEMTRNAYNQARFAKQMIRGNFGKEFGVDLSKMSAKDKMMMRASGIKRAASLAAVTAGAGAVISSFNKEEAGVSDAEDRAYSAFVPEWDTTAPKLYNGKSEDGRAINYSNLNYINPYAMFNQAVKLAMSDQPEDSALSYAAEQLLGEGSIVYKPIINAIQNRDEYGNPITNENKNKEEKLKDISKYLYKQTLETGLEREIRKWFLAAEEKGDLSKADLKNRLVGVRINALDVTDAATFKVRNAMTPYRNEAGRYKSALNRDSLSAVELEDQYQKANRLYGESVDRVRTLAGHLNTLKYSEDEIIDLLLEAGVSAPDVYHVLEGTKPTLDRNPEVTTSDYVDDLLTKNQSDIRKELSVIARTDPNRAKRIVNEIKQRAKLKSKNLTSREQLFLKLSNKDKAKRLINNPQLLEEYAKKGLISKALVVDIQAMMGR